MASKKVKETDVEKTPVVAVEVVAEFHDLKSKTLRKVGEVFETTEERANYLVSRKLVVVKGSK